MGVINYFNVYVWAKGIKPRCRKVDTDIIKIKNEVALDFSQADLTTLKMQATRELAKWKSVQRAELKFSYTTFDTERQSAGFRVETTELFDTKHQVFQLV